MRYIEMSKKIMSSGKRYGSVKLPTVDEARELERRASVGDGNAYYRLVEINRLAASPKTEKEVVALEIAHRAYLQNKHRF